MAVFDIVIQHLFQVQSPRDAVHQSQHYHAESGLHLRVFEQQIQHHIGQSIGTQFDDQAHTVAVGFISDVGNAFDFLFADQFDNFFDESGLIDLIRQFADDNPFAVFFVGFEAGAGADYDLTLTGFISFMDAIHPENDAAGGEVGSGDVVGERRFHHFFHDFFFARFVINEGGFTGGENG